MRSLPSRGLGDQGVACAGAELRDQSDLDRRGVGTVAQAYAWEALTW